MAHAKARRRAGRRRERAAEAASAAPARVHVPPDAEPDHHLWRNGRLWWVAFTVHRGHLQERVRLSLRTDDVAEARRRRDALFALVDGAADCEISLRFAPRKRRGARSEAA
jgi:hypothetical protein